MSGTINASKVSLELLTPQTVTKQLSIITNRRSLMNVNNVGKRLEQTKRYVECTLSLSLSRLMGSHIRHRKRGRGYASLHMFHKGGGKCWHGEGCNLGDIEHIAERQERFPQLSNHNHGRRGSGVGGRVVWYFAKAAIATSKN